MAINSALTVNAGHAAFTGQKDILAKRFNRFANHLFVTAKTIQCSCIKMGDTRLKSFGQQAGRRGLIDLFGIGMVEVHTPQANF